MNRHRVTVTVLSAAVAWAAWRVHAGAGSLGPVTMPAEPWPAAIAVIVVVGIVLSYVLFTVIATARGGGGWRPRT